MDFHQFYSQSVEDPTSGHWLYQAAKKVSSHLERAKNTIDSNSSKATARIKAQNSLYADDMKRVKRNRKERAKNIKDTGSSFRRGHKRKVKDKFTGQSAPQDDVVKENTNSLAFAHRRTRMIKLKKGKSPTMGFQMQSKETIVTFMNADEAQEVGMTTGNNVFSEGDMTLDTDISDFFARPVRIATINWLESSTAGTNLLSFNPWSLWANNTFVKPKLNNYAWFRGDLKLKIQVTASPFYYGMVKMCYRPLPTWKQSTIATGTGNKWLIPYSQQPHIDIVVGEADSWSMTLPFIYPANWVNIQNAGSIVNLGELRTYIYSALESANGTSGTGITINVYAWIDNIQLSGASVGFAMQSGDDEYGEGPVSGVASWVASAASYLEDVPILGPFATATRIGAGAISAIASMFGFTNVPVIEDTKPHRPEAFPKFASSEIGFPVEKLTLDPKNELSVDPRIVGVDSGIDEMSIAYLAGRESYLTTANWASNNLIDDTLFYSMVHPNLYDTNDTQRAIYFTPMAWVARSFKDWRGSIIFRFQIVASKYHKGKLRISFDPSGYSAQHIGNSTLTANVVHTAIVDIGETMNVEFEVPYQQALQFLTSDRAYTTAAKKWNVNTTAPFLGDPDAYNGMLTLRVLNPLTSPIASSSVDVHVFVRAGSDIEFANATFVDREGNLALFAPQSEELSMDPVADHVQFAETQGTADRQYLVHYGENVRSIRTLLHRYELSSMEMIAPSSTAANQFCQFRKYFYKMPRSPGYISSSTVQARNQAGTADYGYNFVNMTNLAWYSNAYLAYRGSINWSFDVSSAGGDIHHLKVMKDNLGSVPAQVEANHIDVSTPSKKNGMVQICRNSGGAAQAVTDQRTNAGLNVVCPNMSRYKFQLSVPANANTGSSVDGSDLDSFVLVGYFPYPSTTSTSPVVVSTYNATGVDFGLYFFVNVPTIYNYATIPLPI